MEMAPAGGLLLAYAEREDALRVSPELAWARAVQPTQLTRVSDLAAFNTGAGPCGPIPSELSPVTKD